MAVAKIFRHGGSQAVRLPKEFRFEGEEVIVERTPEGVLLRAKPARLRTLADVARHLAERFPHAPEFPEVPRPGEQQERDLRW